MRRSKCRCPIGVLSTLLLFSCSSKKDPLDSFNGAEYLVFEAGDLIRTSDRISGSGSIVFNAPLSQIGSKNSFRLSFSIEDGGSLTLVTHSNQTLGQGLKFLFYRTGNSLGASLSTDSGIKEVSSRFSAINATETLAFQIDEHNDETPAHILLWDSSITNFTTDTARLDSELSSFETPGNGSGSFWGVALKRATLTQAERSEHKLKD